MPVLKGDLRVAQTAFQASFLNLPGSNGSTALMLAIISGNAEMVEYLLGLPGIDCNAVNQQQQSALLLSCQSGLAPIISLLIKHKPLPRLAINDNIFSVLDALLNHRNDDGLIKSFLRVYIKNQQLPLDISWGERNDCLLIQLIRQRFNESAKFLIDETNKSKESSRIINLENVEKDTALLVACKLNQVTIASYLLEKAIGLKTNFPNDKGSTPLEEAVENSQVRLAADIIRRGGQLSARIRGSLAYQQLPSNHSQTLEDVANSQQEPEQKKWELIPLSQATVPKRKGRRSSLLIELEHKAPLVKSRARRFSRR